MVSWLSGELTQRQIGVGWALLRDAPAGEPPAGAAPLTVADVEAAFTAIGGADRARLAWPRGAPRCTPCSRARAARSSAFLLRLMGGELRQGALAGVMAEAVAKAAGVPATALRRALMLHGDLAAVAAIALADGRAGLDAVALQVGRPLAPMLAGTAADVPAALAKIAPAAVDWKLDGARIQVHRDGEDVAIYTRTLDDVTARLPEVVGGGARAAGRVGRARRRGDRAARRRAAGAVPGHRRALRHARGPQRPARLALLRRAARRRRGPARRAARGAVRRARARRPGGAPDPAGDRRRRRCRAGRVRRRRRRGPRGRRGQGARRALRGRAARVADG